MEKQIEFEFFYDGPIAKRSEFVGFVDGLEASPRLDPAEALWYYARFHNRFCTDGQHELGCKIEEFIREEK